MDLIGRNHDNVQANAITHEVVAGCDSPLLTRAVRCLRAARNRGCVLHRITTVGDWINAPRYHESFMRQGLVLFDIDGTLLRRAGPHHREALVEAVRRATGLETTTDGIPVQGMLDRDILAAMLGAAGASRNLIQRAMPRMVAVAQSVYVRRCPDLRRKVCPGAR